MAETTNYQRLSVNINDESAAILRKVTRDREINTTEAVRRAIGLLGFVEQLHNNGGRIFTEDAQGCRSILVVLDEKDGSL